MSRVTDARRMCHEILKWEVRPQNYGRHLTEEQLAEKVYSSQSRQRLNSNELANTISRIFHDGGGWAEKKIPLYVEGACRPSQDHAWEIGQGLLHLRRPGWNGLVMLYAAAWYEAFIGITCCYARLICSDRKKYEAFQAWLGALPLILLPYSLEYAYVATDHYEDDLKRWHDLRLPYNPYDLARMVPAPEDIQTLESARHAWQECNQTCALAIRARRLDQLRLTNRERSVKAISFLISALHDRESLLDLFC